jgi:hypothetical protein
LWPQHTVCCLHWCLGYAVRVLGLVAPRLVAPQGPATLASGQHPFCVVHVPRALGGQGVHLVCIRCDRFLQLPAGSGGTLYAVGMQGLCSAANNTTGTGRAMASTLCGACVHEALAGRMLVLCGLVNLSRSKALTQHGMMWQCEACMWWCRACLFRRLTSQLHDLLLSGA